jgi:hypothetical protein
VCVCVYVVCECLVADLGRLVGCLVNLVKGEEKVYSWEAINDRLVGYTRREMERKIDGIEE